MGSDPEQKFIDVVKGRALLERFEKAKPYSNDEMFAAGEWHSWAIENAEKFLASTESFLDILGMLGEENARLTEHLSQARRGGGRSAHPSRDELDRALVNVLSNAMNYPDPVAMIGKDSGPLRKKAVDAVLALWNDTPKETSDGE